MGLKLLSYLWGGIWRGIEKEIEELKRKLDLLIEKGASKEEVYDMSVRIDKKIMEYYSIYELGDITK